MDKDVWERLHPLIDEALDLAPEERAAWISRVREESPTIADEIEVLLAREGTLDRRGFLATPPSVDSLVERVLAGETIGFQRKELERALAPRYELGPVVGRGGMATVYRARDTRHDRDVAIKVIRPDAASALGAERFLAEIRLTANLTHPNILPLLDSGESDGVLYYVMPFIDGESLRAHARRGAMPIDEVVRVLRSVAEALAYAHARGAVHRDIKPDNILIAGRQVWVADFGIAKAMATSTSTQPNVTGSAEAIGSPGYMAPEQIEGRSTVDHRADLYSLGAMGWELLAGRPVFEGDSMQRLFTHHLAAIPERIDTVRPEVPRSLAQAVMKCLEKSPDDRWQSADALVQELEMAPAQSGTRAKRSTTVALAVATCAVVVGVGWWVVHSGSTAPPSAARQVTVIGDALQPRVSPNGKWLMFRRRLNLNAVWIQPVDSGIPMRLADSVPGPASWMDDSTIVVLKQPWRPDTSPPTLLRLPDGHSPNLGFMNASGGQWASAGVGALYHLMPSPQDSTRTTLRRATSSGWSDSVTITLDPGERILWLARNAHPSRLAIATRAMDSSARIAVVAADGKRNTLYTVAVRDSAGFNLRLNRQPSFTPDGRFLDLWIIQDSILRIDARNGTTAPTIIAGQIPTVFFEHMHDGQTPAAINATTTSTWRFPIPVDTARTARIVDKASETVHATLSPDGLMVARIERRATGLLSELVLVTQSSGSRRLLLAVDALLTIPQWSPDGNRIALRVHEWRKTGQWIVVDVRDATVTRLGAPPVLSGRGTIQMGFSPSWSPDGRALYAPGFTDEQQRYILKFMAGVSGDTGIVVSRYWEDSGAKSGDYPEGIVTSPDGKMLVSGGASLTLIPLDGGDPRQLVAYDSLNLKIPVAWVQGEIMYVTRDQRAVRSSGLGMRDIWMVTALGGTPRQVGILPTGCHTSFTVLRGGTEAACFTTVQNSDVWLYPPIRRE